MMRLSTSIALAGLALVQPASAADLGAPAGGFLAACEDLGRFCFAEACGRDQIEAAQGCRTRCPSAVVVGVVPASCRIPDGRPATILRRRG